LAGPEAGSKEVTQEMVLDLDDAGKIIGIEILNLLFYAGEHGLDLIKHVLRTKGEELRYSYDEDSDSFYLRLRSGRSIEQNPIQGALIFNDKRQIVSLSAQW